jgi:hypothetical protein
MTKDDEITKRMEGRRWLGLRTVIIHILFVLIAFYGGKKSKGSIPPPWKPGHCSQYGYLKNDYLASLVWQIL